MSNANPDVVDALRTALKERDRLRRENVRLLAGASEPIAIVGMSCRYPGGVNSPEQLWELVAQGRDAISHFPDDRGWDLERLYDPDPDMPGTSYTREGGFLHDAADFDPVFFGIAPRDAVRGDPQQRLLLEATWEALENAGLDPSSLRGSQAGVFAGAMYQDYGWGRGPTPSRQDGNEPIVGGGSFLSGRVAYTLGLEGPAIAVDTACSTSLVAIHLAAQALRQGECSLALAGGATVLSTPIGFIESSRQRGLAPDGRCKSFADSADGVGLAEGVGMLVLERLSDARREGHRVLATVRGSAVNQDGASNGLTAPNGPSQERVIRQALASARLELKDIDAVEAHGTGTPLGDPIEAGALLATYGQEREQPLKLGSIKSNIGHSQAAAGVAGVIKTVMAMREGVLPKTLHIDEPSSKVDWEAGEIELLRESVPWESNGRPRRAGISSFGASGTNAHVILEEAPETEPVADEAKDGGEAPAQALPGPIPLVLSAKSEEALEAQAGRLASHLQASPDLDPVDVAYSLATTRTSFERRAVAVGADREELLAGLSALASGKRAAGVISGTARTDRQPVFLFPGYGSQWEGMALELIESSPVFARRMRECTEALEPHMEWSLDDVLRGADGTPPLDRVDVGAPALFATMVSLVELWRSCGVEPAAVAGHSQGELIAAHVAGGLSLDDAARAVAWRSRVLMGIDGYGTMASVALPAKEVESRLADATGVEIAALNGPTSTVVTGDVEPLEELLAQCESEGVQARKIRGATGASHSAYVEMLRDDLLEAFAPLSPRSGEIPFHSTVTGEVVDTSELNAEYWYRNAREPVRLEPVVRDLIGEGFKALVEISPHPVLTVGLQETVEAAAGDLGSVAVLSSLRRGEGGAERFALSLSQAHARGVEVEWDAFFEGSDAKAIQLPTYAFQRKRYWLAAGAGTSDPSAIGQADAEHPLLSAAIEDPKGEGLILTGRISLQSHAWLADNAVAGAAVLPGAAFVELALKAGAEVGCEQLGELTLQAPLPLPERRGVQLQVTVGSERDGKREIAIHSRPEGEEGQDGEWACHAEGILGGGAPSAPAWLGAWPPPEAEPVSVDALYDRFAEAGLEYGPAFQGLTAAWTQGEDVYAEVSLASEQAGEAPRFGLHPALLDAALHGAFAGATTAEESVAPKLPFAWSEVSLHGSGASALRVKLAPRGEEAIGVEIADQEGTPVGRIGSLRLRPVSTEQLQAASQGHDGRLSLRWIEATAEAQPLSGDGSSRLVALGEVDLASAERHASIGDLLAALAEGTDGAEAPEAVVCDLGLDRSAGTVESARAGVQGALSLVQEWLAAEALGASRLALLTRGAVAASPEEDPDLATAAVWGLLRSAQSEHPGRFALIDTDGSEASLAALPAALAASGAEPQLALREGELLAPRVVEPKPQPDQDLARSIDPDSTVLITGGVSGLGALVAGHLVAEHGVRHLLLVSRSGSSTEGAEELTAALVEQGAEVRIEACDVSDRSGLEALIGSIPSEHPLGAIVHSAGLLDDSVVESMTAEQLERVFAAKAEAAWHLHELSEGLDLSAFVLFSSMAGTLGGPGQANYAAANVFLDALAQHRRAGGLPGTSIAWSLWADAGAATAHLGESDLTRMERVGVVALSDERGLALFDAALSADDALMLAALFDRAVLRAGAAAGVLPPSLSKLVRVPARRRLASTGLLAANLAKVPEAEREATVLELVRGEAAAVLGHDSAAEVDPDRAFKELGFDSLTAVELRNRLSAATGMRLPATIVFDYPSAAAVASFLLEEVSGGSSARQTVRAQSSEEPIAIVGMSCRYPGDVTSPEQLWELVAQGRDAISQFPDDRGWEIERFYDPDPSTPGTSYVREGGFVHDAADFDPAFFGISPREALATDPQQRLVLEGAWEALEDAGIDPFQLRGTSTGVFAGISFQDYTARLGPSEEDLDGYRLTGGAASVLSGRVAYTLGLEGPTMTVDTACSSSLVTLHLAAQALRAGECSLALAGGVTVLSSPMVFIEVSRQRGLAPDGRSKPFADAADGVGFSEGTGMLVLERLSDAQRAGHPVLAIVRGSAINQDGASNGLTAPNGPSQERVILQALANARLEPKDVDAVEAHGTGTTLGDPIEAGALLATYGQERETPLKLGSVKSNIGHTQAAAGAAGVIKTVMAMREGVLPKSLHIDAPSSNVDWEMGKIELLTEPVEWKPNGHPRRAGISSFGVSGTNAHVILEEPPASAKADANTALPGPIPLVLSAKGEQALRDQASRLADLLRASPDLDPVDVAYALTATRASFERRAVALGQGREELMEALDALAKGEASANALAATARSGRLAYLFTGQGSQRAGMGKELYETYPAYAKALDEACEQVDQHTERPLKELLFSEPGSKEAALLDHTSYAQPALFATEVALFRLLESRGLRPDLLTGHSVGEIVAAHLAGVFSLSDAAKLVAARGKLMGELPEGGAMLAIEATEAEALEAIEGKEGQLSLAAINGPTAAVVSGEEKAVDAIEAAFEAKERKTKRLTVSHAFHSPLIEPMLEPFAEVAAGLDYQEPKIPIISNLSGELLSKEQAQDPAYWVEHARQPVRFAKGIETLRAQGATAYAELGPDAVLTAMAASCLPDEDPALIATLREGRAEPGAIAMALASAHAHGAALDWDAFFKGTGAKAVPLPTYPFQRQRYWLDSTASSSDPAAIGQEATDHPLLSAAIADPAGDGLTLTGRISLQSHPWLADHAVAGTVLLPGTGFVELALRAGAEVGCELLEELTLQAPLVIPDAGGVALQVAVAPPGGKGERTIAIHSRQETEEAEWTCHAQGILGAEVPSAPEPQSAWPPQGAEAATVDALYDRLAEAGFEYGPAFQGLTAAWTLGEEVYAEVSLAPEQVQEAARFGVHPALLDASLHGVFVSALASEQAQGLRLPFAWNEVSLHGPSASELRVRIAPEGEEAIRIELADQEGSPIARVGSLRVRPVSLEQLQAASRPQDGQLRVEWVKAPSEGGPPAARLMALGDIDLPGVERHESVEALCAALSAGAEEAEAAEPSEAPEALEAPEAPEAVVCELSFERSATIAETARGAAQSALTLVQEWLGVEALAASRLVVLTNAAVATDLGQDPDLATAPVWGLLRSAQAEHPGHFAVIDTDGSEASLAALPAAMAASATEPQLALREGELLTPRVVEAKVEAGQEPSQSIDPDSTVLVTGATSGIGAVIARHLAAEHGARHLLLISRRGEEAEGVGELRAAIEEQGAEVRIEACDVSDRSQLEALLASISPEHPLGAIVHSAGVIADGVIESMTPGQLESVFAPKVDAAWHLHELSEGLDLSAFVVFSSMAGTVGSPGQANYAAANAFLDALSQHRQVEGLPATAMAWGLWERKSGMTADLGEADLERVRRLGAAALTDEQGLALFDAALRIGHPLALTVHIDPARFASLDSAGILPPILRGLVKHRAKRRSGPTISLATRLAKVPEAEREATVLELVRGEAAAVLGHASAKEIPPDRPFNELGFDSLAAVEMRNRLGLATDMRLPATLIFDYPTSAAIAHYLLGQVEQGDAVSADTELNQLEQALTALPAGDPQRSKLAAHLRALASDLESDGKEERGSDIDRLEEVSDDELLEFIDEQVGSIDQG